MSPATLNFYEQLTVSRYGAMEMKQLIGPNLLKGLVFSFLVHFTVITAPLLLTLLQGEEAVLPQKIVVFDASQVVRLQIQQDLTQQQLRIALPKMAAPAVFIPVSVPFDPEETPLYPTQIDITRYLGADPNDATIGLNPGEQIVVIEPPIAEEAPDPTIFVPFEEAPQALDNFSPLPAYPKLAEQSGVKGRVVVLCLVDKTGNVVKHQYKSVQPENLGFKEEVEKIIGQWKFTPAIQNKKPIAVWVEIPFNFDSEH